MTFNKKIAYSALLVILSFSIWIYTFFVQFGDTYPWFLPDFLPYIFTLRFFAFLFGMICGLYLFINFIEVQKYGQKVLYLVQYVSILTGIGGFLSMYTYVPATHAFRFTNNQATDGIAFLLGFISLATFPFVVIISLQRKKSLLLTLFNLIVIVPHVIWALILLLLLGIGFGPPS